ncbi:MAG: hypothetical protein ACOCYB_06190, partial [Alkalispirochaeta sp.]
MRIHTSVRILALVIGAAGIVLPLSAQDDVDTGEDRLAPSVPAHSQALDLLLAVPETDPPVGSDLELVRYGQAGRLSRPNALDIPERPQAVRLAAWDWVRPQGRSLELAARDPYRIWLEVHDGMQGILISTDHMELYWGTVEWKDSTDSAAERHISAGDVLVRGRGTARISRDSEGVLIEVET